MAAHQAVGNFELGPDWREVFFFLDDDIKAIVFQVIDPLGAAAAPGSLVYGDCLRFSG